MRKQNSLEIFDNFHNRDSDLINITRYNLYPVMFYRTNLLIHSHRVAWIVRTINPTAQKIFGASYDVNKAEILAYVHDDAEIIMGDVQAGNKNNMTALQLADVQKMEIGAIKKISNRFPELVGAYDYTTLLNEAMNHSSLEAQVLQYADKFDALGEALHEVYGGNVLWTQNVINEYGTIPTPLEYYWSFFERFEDKYPQLQPLLATNIPIFQSIPPFDQQTAAMGGQLHSPDSIRKTKSYAPYSNWLKINLDNATPQQLATLYTQVEYNH